MWSGWGLATFPDRVEGRVVERLGADLALELLPWVRRLEDEFYESDAVHTVAGLKEMGDRAAQRFRSLRPEISTAAVEALAWCYTWDFK